MSDGRADTRLADSANAEVGDIEELGRGHRQTMTSTRSSFPVKHRRRRPVLPSPRVQRLATPSSSAYIARFQCHNIRTIELNALRYVCSDLVPTMRITTVRVVSEDTTIRASDAQEIAELLNLLVLVSSETPFYRFMDECNCEEYCVRCGVELKLYAVNTAPIAPRGQEASLLMVDTRHISFVPPPPFTSSSTSKSSLVHAGLPGVGETVLPYTPRIPILPDERDVTAYDGGYNITTTLVESEKRMQVNYITGHSPIKELEPGQSIHYRLVAQKGDGQQSPIYSPVVRCAIVPRRQILVNRNTEKYIPSEGFESIRSHCPGRVFDGLYPSSTSLSQPLPSLLSSSAPSLTPVLASFSSQVVAKVSTGLVVARPHDCVSGCQQCVLRAQHLHSEYRIPSTCDSYIQHKFDDEAPVFHLETNCALTADETLTHGFQIYTDLVQGLLYAAQKIESEQERTSAYR